MKLAAGSVSIGLALIPFLCAPPMSASCNSGPDTCLPGYVWRRAFPGDHVCVPPASRDRARTDNALATSRRSSNGGPYGADTCTPGYVWREASSTDHVCVAGDTRQETSTENSLARERRDPSCAPDSITPRRDVATVMDRLTQVSKAFALAALTVLGLIALAMTYFADLDTGRHTTRSIAPKAVASLFYAVLAWPWPLAAAWEDYVRRQHGDPIYRVTLSKELMSERVILDPFVAIGIAGCCVLAIMFGRAALRDIRASPRRFGGAVLAQTGRTLGFVVLIPLLIWWAWVLLALVAMSGFAH